MILDWPLKAELGLFAPRSGDGSLSDDHGFLKINKSIQTTNNQGATNVHKHQIFQEIYELVSFQDILR